MLNILLPEPESYSEKCQEILSSIGKLTAKKMSREEILKVIKDFDILVIRLGTIVDKKLIDRGKKLKIIGTATTGTDHIDVEYANKKGIEVASLKEESEFLEKVNASTEHTLALTLSIIRKIPWAFESVKRGEWRKEEYYGRELFGKNLGIVGFGRIGKKIAKFGIVFGMKVFYYDPYVNIEENGIEKVDFEKLLEISDLISVHVELTPETEKMFSRKEFKLMKRKPYFINTSRGKVVDEKALIEALKKGWVSGAAIDVIGNETSNENPIKNSILRKYAEEHDNLLITPHIAGSTFESMEITGIFIAEKIRNIVQDRFSF